MTNAELPNIVWDLEREWTNYETFDGTDEYAWQINDFIAQMDQRKAEENLIEIQNSLSAMLTQLGHRYDHMVADLATTYGVSLSDLQVTIPTTESNRTLPEQLDDSAISTILTQWRALQSYNEFKKLFTYVNSNYASLNSDDKNKVLAVINHIPKNGLDPTSNLGKVHYDSFIQMWTRVSAKTQNSQISTLNSASPSNTSQAQNSLRLNQDVEQQKENMQQSINTLIHFAEENHENTSNHVASTLSSEINNYILYLSDQQGPWTSLWLLNDQWQIKWSEYSIYIESIPTISSALTAYLSRVNAINSITTIEETAQTNQTIQSTPTQNISRAQNHSEINTKFITKQEELNTLRDGTDTEIQTSFQQEYNMIMNIIGEFDGALSNTEKKWYVINHITDLITQISNATQTSDDIATESETSTPSTGTVKSVESPYSATIESYSTTLAELDTKREGLSDTHKATFQREYNLIYWIIGEFDNTLGNIEKKENITQLAQDLLNDMNSIPIEIEEWDFNPEELSRVISQWNDAATTLSETIDSIQQFNESYLTANEWAIIEWALQVITEQVANTGYAKDTTWIDAARTDRNTLLSELRKTSTILLRIQTQEVITTDYNQTIAQMQEAVNQRNTLREVIQTSNIQNLIDKIPDFQESENDLRITDGIAVPTNEDHTHAKDLLARYAQEEEATRQTILTEYEKQYTHISSILEDSSMTNNEELQSLIDTYNTILIEDLNDHQIIEKTIRFIQESNNITTKAVLNQWELDTLISQVDDANIALYGSLTTLDYINQTLLTDSQKSIISSAQALVENPLTDRQSSEAIRDQRDNMLTELNNIHNIRTEIIEQMDIEYIKQNTDDLNSRINVLKEYIGDNISHPLHAFLSWIEQINIYDDDIDEEDIITNYTNLLDTAENINKKLAGQHEYIADIENRYLSFREELLGWEILPNSEDATAFKRTILSFHHDHVNNHTPPDQSMLWESIHNLIENYNPATLWENHMEDLYWLTGLEKTYSWLQSISSQFTTNSFWSTHMIKC